MSAPVAKSARHGTGDRDIQACPLTTMGERRNSPPLLLCLAFRNCTGPCNALPAEVCKVRHDRHASHVPVHQHHSDGDARKGGGAVLTQLRRKSCLCVGCLSSLCPYTPPLHLRPEHFDGTHGSPAAYRTDMQFVYGANASLVLADKFSSLADNACPTERSYGTARKKHAVQEPLQDALQMLHTHTCPICSI